MLPETGGATGVVGTFLGDGGAVFESDVPGAVDGPALALECAGLLLGAGAAECEPLHAASIDRAPAHASAQRRLACTRISPVHFPRRGSGIPATA
jgi:hypothetical protein